MIHVLTRPIIAWAWRCRVIGDQHPSRAPRCSAASETIGTSEEIAEIVAFLASDAASYITGENIVIGGGAGIRP